MSDEDYLALTGRDENAWRQSMKGILRQQVLNLINSIESSNPTLTSSSISKYFAEEEMARVYERLCKSQGKKYFNFTLNELKNAVPSYTLKDEGMFFDRMSDDPYLRNIYPYIDQVTGDKVTTIVGHNRDYAIELIKEIVEEVAELGLGEIEAIRRIRKMVMARYETTLEFRAQRIARTEVAALANFASYAGAVETGLDFDKYWMATLDSRVRFDHVQANGQTVRKSDKFTVGGHLMSYPCEYGAPADQVINCRCRLGYVPYPFGR